jgi:F-type H+-transporting ATPase subunit b
MDINLTLFAQAAVFAILIWVAARWPWRWLMDLVEERNKKIADGLAAAEKGNRSLEEAAVKSAEELKTARGQAQDIIGGANKQATQLIEQARGQAKVEADRIVEAAKSEVERQVQQAREQLRKQLGELAVAGASKILKREIDAKAHADVLQELAAKI